MERFKPGNLTNMTSSRMHASDYGYGGGGGGGEDFFGGGFGGGGLGGGGCGGGGGGQIKARGRGVAVVVVLVVVAAAAAAAAAAVVVAAQKREILINLFVVLRARQVSKSQKREVKIKEHSKLDKATRTKNPRSNLPRRKKRKGKERYGGRGEPREN